MNVTVKLIGRESQRDHVIALLNQKSESLLKEGEERIKSIARNQNKDIATVSMTIY